jgi:PRTRC genetic system protein E
MFQQLDALVRASGKLQMILKTDGDRMSVVVVPQGDSKESVLRQPLVLSGTAAELDDGFAEAIGQYSVAHASLSEQVAATTAILQQAEKGQASKAQKSLAKGSTASAGKGAAVDQSGEEPDDDDGASRDTSVQTPVPPASDKAAGTDLLSLLG